MKTASPTGSVRVQLVGAPQLFVAAGKVHELERREAALLALLALDGPTPRGKAASLLWSDTDTERQRGSLRQRLFHLRRKAGCDLVVPGETLVLARTVEHDLHPIAARLIDDPHTGSGE